MNTYIALFRGVNVLGKNLLPMKELVGIFEELGFCEVRTYIQSGNVVFRSAPVRKDAAATEIGAAIGSRYGFTPRILLLEPPELRHAVHRNPFPTGNGKALHLFFLEYPAPKPDLAALQALRTGSEAFVLHETTFYLYTPDGFGRSKLAAKVERCLGVPATARNWNTVRELLALAGEPSRIDRNPATSH